jgi:hypothetical protein
MFPERLHMIALTLDVVTLLLSDLEQFFTTGAAEARTRQTTTDPALTASTRRRLEAIKDRHTHRQ